MKDELYSADDYNMKAERFDAIRGYPRRRDG